MHHRFATTKHGTPWMRRARPVPQTLPACSVHPGYRTSGAPTTHAAEEHLLVEAELGDPTSRSIGEHTSHKAEPNHLETLQLPRSPAAKSDDTPSGDCSTPSPENGPDAALLPQQHPHKQTPKVCALREALAHFQTQHPPPQLGHSAPLPSMTSLTRSVSSNSGDPNAHQRTCDFGLASCAQQHWRRTRQPFSSPTDSALTNESVNAALGTPSRLWVARVRIGDHRYEALVDSGASRSFILPSVTVAAHLETEPLDDNVEFQVASGDTFHVRTLAPNVTYHWEGHTHASATGDFLVAYIPYPLILGMDCLHSLGAIWDVAGGTLRLCVYDPPIDVVLVERPTKRQSPDPKRSALEDLEGDKQMAQEAKNQMQRDIKDLSSHAAAALVRPNRKHYKSYRTAHRKIPIKQLIKNLQQNQEKFASTADTGISTSVDGLALIVIPRETADSPIPRDRVKSQFELIGPANGLIFHYQGKKTSATSLMERNRPVRYYRTQPPRPIPGCMPRKGVVYRIMGEELEAQRQILQELKANRWISLTQSPFAAPSMIVSKKDDASGNKQFRMVVNYQELNSMTISAEY
ncbi:hypothetical protein Emed_000003 [Eimeria media]